MKKKISRGFAITLATVICLSLLPLTALAADTPSAWANEQVNEAINVKLVPQSLQTNYTQATTRAEFCALAVAVYETVRGEGITDRKPFDDTNDINVLKAAAIGIVTGVGNNNFDPDAKLTREQAAVMLARLAETLGTPLTQQAATFADNGNISTWAYSQVGQIQGAGIMSGVGNNTFAPKSDYTREQSILTVLRLYNMVKEKIDSGTSPQTVNTMKVQAGDTVNVSRAFAFTPPAGATWSSSDSSVAYVDSKTNDLVALSAGRTQIECLEGGKVAYSVVLTVEGYIQQDSQQDSQQSQDADRQQTHDSDSQQAQDSDRQQTQDSDSQKTQDQEPTLQRLSFDPSPIPAEDGYTWVWDHEFTDPSGTWFSDVGIMGRWVLVKDGYTYYVHRDGKIFARETPGGAYTTWSFPSNPTPCGTPPGLPTEP